MDSSVQAAEKILNYSFVNKTLLKDALTQTSPLFDRLELLGDSVLEVTFTNYIHNTYPNLKLKEFRELRTANVSNEKFARVAVNHNLYQFLLRHNPSLFTKIKEFSEAVSKEADPVPYGGLVKAPKVLADIVESIAGAVYIDVNFDELRLWEIFRGLFEPIYTPDDLRQQPKPPFLTLFRLADKHGKRIDFRYSKDEESSNKNVAEVYLDGIFIASGCAKRLDTAKQLAADGALLKLSECMPIEKIIATTASEKPLADEMRQEEMVIDEDSPHVEHDDAKGKLFEVCYSRKLQIQTGSSSLPTASENMLTYEMTTKQMVVDKDSLNVEPEDVKGKLLAICSKNKWPKPIYSVEEQKGPKNEPRFVCSVKIEIPTVEGAFHMKGDLKSKKKQAENSSAHHMIRALDSSLMTLVISNLQMPKSLDTKNPSLVSSDMDSDSAEALEKILNYSFVNKNLLKDVLTHNGSPFQRLISVGEPALSLAFMKHLYLTYPKLGPKDLSMLRDANTCNDRCARVAVKKGISELCLRNVQKPEKMITEFIELIGKEDDSDTDPYRSVKAPKTLANLVDAVAGAVYIDVNYNVQRLWEVFRGLFEPIYTLDDLRLQPSPQYATLFRLAHKHGKQIDFRYSKDVDIRKNITEVYLDDIFIASGCAKHIETSKLLAAEKAVQKLSECMPIKKISDDVSPLVEPEDVKRKSFDICSTEKFQLQTESSSIPTASVKPSTDGMTQEQMVINEDCSHVEPEDVKGKLFDICSTEKLQLQTESSLLPIAFDNHLTDELTQEQMVIDENSIHVEPEDVKEKLFDICSTKRLQTQTGSSSLSTAAENPSTYAMTTKQMVIDQDREVEPEDEPEDVKGKLFEICAKNKWSNPVFSVEEQKGPKNEPRFVCSVKIEIPTIEGTFHMKGDAKPKKKQAENSSADHMIRALKSSIMSLVISNLQMPKSLDEKKKNLQMHESLDDNKNLHSKKRRTV
ncbi:ribonuclease 3-like protein 3 isoform X2 [Capsella rubella]|uniref:ribonuclease 3-like protein 3 isoform X2 n=1 Tax=Capsella rubella TaxID=81985 RepID=UPI000CD50728|nr:ribonuclease 3-like protein 3 isoform X2 [Capsella rubella]